MKFHICNIEPQGYPFGHFLDDTCRLFCYAFESLGHSCSIGPNQLEPDRINVIFCGHLLRTTQEVDTVAGACRYIALQHEVLHSDGVNLTQDKVHLDQVYFPFLRRAISVWEGTERNAPALRRLGTPYCLLRGGYHPYLEEVRPKRERDVDFLFYGSVTPHRRTMLEQLTRRGHQVVATFDSRSTHRNDLIARARVNLAPLQGPGMEHFAYGRVCYLLNNQSLVVVEKGLDQEWLQDCFISTSTEHWADVCEQTLRRQDQNQIRQEFCNRFKQLPFTDQLAKLLDETFGRSAGAASRAPVELSGHQFGNAIAR